MNAPVRPLPDGKFCTAPRPDRPTKQTKNGENRMVNLHLHRIDAPASQYMPPRLAEVAERAFDARESYEDHVEAHRDLLASDWEKRARRRDDEAMAAGE